MRSFSFRQRVLLSVIPALAAIVIRLLGMTLTYENVFAPGEPNPVPGDEIPGPTVYAFWHQSLLACAHRFRNKNIAILISPSFDGELIARTVELLGFRAVRGSSTRSGATALRGMAEAYAQGHRCAITADGPRGPARIAKPGTAQLTTLVGAPWVGTFYALPLSAWTLKTWDTFLIPKPFSKVLLAFPPHIPANTPDLRSAVQASLDGAVTLTNAKRPLPHEVPPGPR